MIYVRCKSSSELTKDTPYLTLTGEVRSIFYKYIKEKDCVIRRFYCIVTIFLFQNINLKFSLVLSCLPWSPHRWVHKVMWDLPSSCIKSIALTETFQSILTPSTSNTQQIQSLHIRLYKISSIWEDPVVNQIQGAPLNSSDIPLNIFASLWQRK